jgi:hypothetical protein
MGIRCMRDIGTQTTPVHNALRLLHPMHLKRGNLKCPAIRQKLPFFVTLHLGNLLDTHDPHLMYIGRSLQHLFDAILFQCPHAIAQRGNQHFRHPCMLLDILF